MKMKIVRTSFSENPLMCSFTLLKDGNLRQVSFNEDELNNFFEKNNLTLGEFATILANTDDSLFELINTKNFITQNEVQTELNDVSDVNLDEIPLNLKIFLQQIIKNDLDKEKLKSWAKFTNNLMENVDPYIRQQLFGFLSYLIEKENSLSITTDGNILAYKGLRYDSKSIHSGEAYVNGILHSGHIPNNKDDIISMKRNKVEANPESSCSYGLHAGSYSYASNFGSLLAVVEIDPKHVVSIPNDYNSQKLRAEQYKVVATNIKEPLKERIVDLKLYKEEQEKSKKKLSDLSQEELDELLNEDFDY